MRKRALEQGTKGWKTPFFTIVCGQTVSLVGSSAVQFALIWWITSKTESALMLGLAGFVAFLPTILLSPLAGVAADRYPRKYICISADLFIGLTAAAFAVAMWVFDLPVWSALIILMLRGIGNTFHQPSIQAIIPQLVPKEELVKANGWSQMMASGSFMLGPVLGAALYAAFPLPVVLLTDLVGAVVASGMLAAVPIPRLRRDGPAPKMRMMAEIKEGLTVYRQDKRLYLIVITETVCMLFYFPLSSFYPLMTSSYFRASAWHASAVELAYAAGMLVAALLLGGVIKIKRNLFTAYCGLLGIGVASAVCGVLPPTMWAWWIFAATCGVMGAFGNIHNIPLIAYMQETIEPEKMGRAFSLLSLLSSLAMPIGLLIASPIAEKIGVHSWFLITGVMTVGITAVAMGLNGRLEKHGEKSD